jgi:hypothetical protein
MDKTENQRMKDYVIYVLLILKKMNIILLSHAQTILA